MAEILVGKVRPDLTNNLTQTVTGNALDAVQGKVLDDKITTQGQQIGVLENDRGYLGAKEIRSGSIDNLNSGKYIILMDVPNLGVWGYLDVNKYNDDEWEQTFTSMDKNNPFKKVRVKQSGTIGTWKPLATTEKTEILLPLATGYKVSDYRSNKVFKDSNGFVTIQCGISKIDGSNLDTAIDTLVATLPVGYRPLGGTQRLNVPFVYWGGVIGIGQLYLDINGEVRYTTINQAPKTMFINVSFYAN